MPFLSIKVVFFILLSVCLNSCVELGENYSFLMPSLAFFGNPYNASNLQCDRSPFYIFQKSYS